MAKYRNRLYIAIASLLCFILPWFPVMTVQELLPANTFLHILYSTIWFLDNIRFLDGKSLGLGLIILSLWTLPILVIFNVLLLLLKSSVLKATYRTFLLIFFILTLYRTWLTEELARGIGFWAYGISIATFLILEIYLIWLELKTKR